MSRIIGILAVVGILAAAVFASAAALPVDGGTIQAGEDTDLACTDMGVYVPAWGLNTLAGEYEGVEYVWIAPAGDLNSFIAACNGAKIYARVSDGSKNYYSSGTASGYTNVTVGVTPPADTGVTGVQGWKLFLQDGQPGPLGWPKAENITSIKVWLEGGS